MRYIKVFLALAIASVLTGSHVFASPSQINQSLPPARVFWFSDEEHGGLRQDAAGNLVILHHKLPLRQPVSDLYAAAYYLDADVLVTVDKKAVTRFYARGDAGLKLIATRPPHESKDPKYRHGPIRPITVRFCMIPGLVYLTWSYPEPDMPVQMSVQHSERLALGEQARNWHAVTPENPKVKFLAYTYQVRAGKVIHFFMPDGKRIILHLRDELAEPGDPFNSRSEPISVLPERAIIICQTRTGWSLHNFDGKLTHSIAVPAKQAQYHHLGKWSEPFYYKGYIYISEITQGYLYHRFDLQQDKLIYVGSKLPK